MITISVIEVLIVVGLLVFTRGFLPPTLNKPGFSDLSTDVPPQFSKLVFMVVDAMRSDFMFAESSNMSNVHNLLNQGHGYGFTAFSDPPTVTLPRLKGLSTGATPNFLDAVVNIAEADTASTLHNQDSWVHQFHEMNKSMHLYGDDTWLKLFPNYFNNVDGTSSFFVSDYTEVDNNVTRHLNPVLRDNSYDLLVLHYLGLDHIGHKGGAKSPLLPTKEGEMDEIIAKIYASLNNDTLFVVAGDHGMNEVGNHGGASKSETSAAMLFLSPRFNNPVKAPLPEDDDFSYYTRVKQVDLVPTLAYLLGFPVPKNSLGLMISDMLSMWGTADQSQILNSMCTHFEFNIASACNWGVLASKQEELMKSSTEYLFDYMYAGLIILGICILFLAYVVLTRFGPSLPWIGLLTLYFIGMMGSSTVEEEHYIWYWSLTSALLIALFKVPKSQKLKIFVLLAGLRVIRGWNSIGQKWVALDGFSNYLDDHPKLMLTVLVATTLFFISSSKSKVLGTVNYAAVLGYKLAAVNTPLCDPKMIVAAQVIFVLSIFTSLICKQPPLSLYLMQTKTNNLGLWPVFAVMKDTLDSLALDGPTRALLFLGFEFTTFFSTGGSNSLATIDLSNAYNGISGYNIPLVSLLTYLGNWSASLFWVDFRHLKQNLSLRALFYTIMCFSVCLTCLILREHLFIWTVFAPKILYVGAWLAFHELLATKLGLFIHYVFCR